MPNATTRTVTDASHRRPAEDAEFEIVGPQDRGLARPATTAEPPARTAQVVREAPPRAVRGPAVVRELYDDGIIA